MRKRRHAKIIATLGPNTSSPEAIEALWEAGADVFRVNMSHGGRDDHRGRVKAIRAVERKIKRPIGILADLQGPKFRIGTFAKGPVELTEGQPFRLDLSDKPGDAKRVTLPHPDVIGVLAPGNDLLLDDGKIRLTVEKTGKDFVQTVVATGGPLSDRKGVNLPGVLLPVSALTDKDRRDLTFALELGADWIALSFVQRPDDIAELRKLTGNRASIVAKIEKPAALDYFEEIVELTDAVMVARGDLGVEIPPEDVPSIQKHLVGISRQAGKPVIVATQMLDSMVDAPTPTRAEASDVAGAVYEGADAVMLSAETAVGRYPRETVAIMDRIIRRTERDPTWRLLMDAGGTPPSATAVGAITAAARHVAESIGAAAVITYTSSGSTALRAARARPSAPILCLTGSDQTARKLTLAWGVESFFSHDAHSVEEMVDYALAMAKDNEFADRGQPIVITAGMPFGTPGATNMLRIAWVG
ncbi:MAG: pyruvate kinase [Bauldia litoralis]